MTTPAIHPADVRVVPDWELADRLRRSMRLVRGMTNIDAAEILGVQRETISTWLNARRTPPKTTVMIWADMTGVDREWLLTGVPSKEWYAIRDSNPEPADLVPLRVARPFLRLIHSPSDPRPASVKPRFTLIGRAS